MHTKLKKTALVIGAVAIAAIAAFLLAGPVQAQVRIDRGRDGSLSVFGGRDTQVGVTARDLSTSEAERLKVDGGIYIETVLPDGPAAKAGLKVADVITEFDGERVRSVQQFTRLVRESAPDRAVRLKYHRDGRSSDLSITPAPGSSDLRFTSRLGEPLQSLRVPPLPDFNFDFGNGTWPPLLGGALRRGAQLGVTVQELTPDLAAYFGAKDGVLVSSVVADSPAGRAGIKVGDVITSSNGRPVFQASDLTRDVNASSAGGEITLGIVRDKKEMTIKATIDEQTERRLNPILPGRPLQPLRRPIGNVG